MRAIIYAAVLAASTAAAPSFAAITAVGSPCGAEKCPEDAHPEAKRLNDAWWSDITTDAERVKIAELIKSSTVQGAPNWPAASLAYFQWRGAQHGYAYDPNGKPRPRIPAPEPKWAQMRMAGEAAIRARLIDPSSAEFEWPFGFYNGTWKPFLQKRVFGWFTCGEVNAKNRMGGYVGRHSFVVVLNGEQVIFADMDDPTDKLGIVDIACAKTAPMLPPAPAGMVDMPHATAAPASVDVADELTKLAALRDKGIITPGEFDAQKAKLLAQ